MNVQPEGRFSGEESAARAVRRDLEAAILLEAGLRDEQLAEELGNVSKAYRIMRYHRDSFYEIR